jgi:hypothetical protein
VVGEGIGDALGDGVDVGVAEGFGWFADCPNTMYAPIPMMIMAVMPITINNVLLDLRFGGALLFLLGVMSW